MARVPGPVLVMDAGLKDAAKSQKPAKTTPGPTDSHGLLAPPFSPTAGPFSSKGSHDAAFLSLPVAKRQTILKNAGFAVAVDGITGPQTATATRAYLKGVSPSVWNHAWSSSHAISNTPPAPAVATPMPARTPNAHVPAAAVPPASPTSGLLDQVLGGLGAYKPPTMKELMDQAKELAEIQIGPQVTLYKQQQDQAIADAERRAKLQAQIGAALAEVLKSQGPEVAATYRAAGADQAGLASGFSGDLRESAAADAQKINELLDSIGAPSAQHVDTAPTDAAANVLYGLGGYLPASTLGREGAAFAAAADLLPQTATGQGAQLAANELHAGADAKKQLALQLAALETQRPGLVRNALGQLQDASTKNAAAAQNQALLPLLLAGKFDALPGVNPITGTRTSKQASIDAADRSAAIRAAQLGITEARLKAQLIKDASTAKEKGRYHGLKTKDYQHFASQALGAARNYHAPWKDADGNDQDPLSWQQYLTHGLNAGIPMWVLIDQGRKVYSQQEIKQGLIPGA